MQHLLLCMPCIRQVDSTLRRFWALVRRDSRVPMNKLFLEMLESPLRWTTCTHYELYIFLKRLQAENGDEWVDIGRRGTHDKTWLFLLLSLSLYTHNHGVFKQGKKIKKKKLYIGFYKNKYTYSTYVYSETADTKTHYTQFLLTPMLLLLFLGSNIIVNVARTDALASCSPFSIFCVLCVNTISLWRSHKKNQSLYIYTHTQFHFPTKKDIKKITKI